MLTESERELIAKVKAAHEAATPGEWVDWYESFDRGDIMARVTDDDPELEPLVEDVLFGNRSGENWDLIKLVRNSIPSLLAIIERLEEKLKLVTASHRNKDD